MDEASRRTAWWLTALLAPLLIVVMLVLAVLAGLLWYVLAGVCGVGQFFQKGRSWVQR